MKVLMSIKPEYANKILTGEKLYEYRRTIFKQKGIQTVLIYATYPICKIIGEFEIERIITDTPDLVWNLTQDYSGISQDFFDEYFKDKALANAIKIKEVKKYQVPISLSDLKKGLKAPQSFSYIQ